MKKKPTLGPAQCEHCHQIWYGEVLIGKEEGVIAIPDNMVLCLHCWSALDTHIYKTFPKLYDSIRNRTEARNILVFYETARAWILDETQKPFPAKRHYKGVSLWMRLAVEQGMVKTNSYDVYTITLQDGEPVHVEVREKAAS